MAEAAKAMRVDVVLEEGANDEAPKLSDKRKPQRWVAIASGTGALLLFLVTYILRLDRVAGIVVDDAWYILLAKALATGQGYTLINSPSPGILPVYPPAFPWVLSLVYRLAPQFPQNVWLLKSVSLIAMLGVGIAAYWYFVRDRELPRYVALGIAVATVVSPPLIYFATSTVMSEAVFMLSQLLTVMVIERCVRERKGGRVWLYALLAVGLASFTFLTRSISVVLIIGAFVYLVKEGLSRTALVFVAGVLLLVGPWLFNLRIHAPTAEQRMEQGSHIVQSYFTQFWQRDAAEASLGTASMRDLLARILRNSIRILRSEVGTVFVDPLTQIIKYRSPRGGEGFSFILSVLAFAGFVSAVRERVTLAEIVVPLSLMIIVVWPWLPQRFVLPLSPFLILYVLMGVQVVHRLCQRLRRTLNPRARWVAVGSIIWCVVAINTLGNVVYTHSFQGLSSERSKRIQNFDEVEAMFKWIRENIPQEEVIATFNPPLIHLYTGHKTIFPEGPVGDWSNWRRPGVRYLVVTPWHRIPDFSPVEGSHKVVYQSRGNRNFRVIALDARREYNK